MCRFHDGISFGSPASQATGAFLFVRIKDTFFGSYRQASAFAKLETQ
jgi:hypothetical protein